MADVFISYAKADVDRIQTLIEALEEEGFEVWWDNRLEAGETFDDVIERELDAASSVIVVWTKNSKESRWVRSEASLADELGKLVPISLEPDAIPIQFRLVHAENFENWDGNKTENCWQRLTAIVTELVTSVAEATDEQAKRYVNLKPKNIGSSVATSKEEQKPIAVLPVQSGNEPIVLGVLSLAIVSLLTIGPFSEVRGSAFLISMAIMALVSLTLFLQAERWLSPQSKALVSSWFLPIHAGASVSVGEAFRNIFESVFGIRHFSLFCLRRSLLVSFASYILVSAIIFQVHPDSQLPSSYVAAVGLTTQVMIGNGIIDYVSLLKTRLLLKEASGGTFSTLILVLLDFVLTPAVFLVTFYIIVVVASLLAGITGTSSALNAWIDSGTDQQSVSAIAWIGWSSFATTFSSSLWLWAVLVFTPLSRLFVWSGPSATGLGRLLQVEMQPIAALGYLIAFFLTAIGVIWMGIQLVLA